MAIVILVAAGGLARMLRIRRSAQALCSLLDPLATVHFTELHGLTLAPIGSSPSLPLHIKKLQTFRSADKIRGCGGRT